MYYYLETISIRCINKIPNKVKNILSSNVSRQPGSVSRAHKKLKNEEGEQPDDTRDSSKGSRLAERVSQFPTQVPVPHY